jgi:hypothetical protein
MKPEQQQIAIAEACGLNHPPAGIQGACWVYPDYLNDLNAMHEAEKVLTSEQYADDFIYHLGCVFNDNGLCIIAKAVHATAAQRAEAFLRTLNLWKD